MGRRSRRVRNAASSVVADDDDDDSEDDSLSSVTTLWSEAASKREAERVDSREYELERLLDALYEKRAQTREKALVGLVQAFENHVVHEFMENKCITLLHQFISSIKRGSSKEVSLASRATGLLAITAGSGGNAHEIIEEALPHLHQALKSGTDSLKRSSVVDCLAILTFVGGGDEETEQSMKIIWEMINPKLGANVVLSKPTPSLLSAAVSAWSFLLTSMNDQKAKFTNWQETIALLANLLEKDDRSTRIAAGEALALIFDKQRVKIGALDDLPYERCKTSFGIAYVEALKGKILSQARNLSMEAGGKGSVRTDLNTQRDVFQRVVYFIETGKFHDVSIKVFKNCNPLRLSSWAQVMQLNFLKHFLGSGYLRHMQDNELLHDIFAFVPKKRENLSDKEKRIHLSPNSVANKERTLYLNKQRMWAQDRNHGHFAFAEEDF